LLAIAKFVVNNKTYSVTKMFLFIANYSREMRMGVNIRKESKSRKDNRVCRKNKEDTKESRSSIKESLGKDKETSR